MCGSVQVKRKYLASKGTQARKKTVKNVSTGVAS